MSVTDVFPPSTKGAGRTRVQYVKTLAAANEDAVTVAELNAASSFDFTPYCPASAFDLGHSQATEDDTRLSDENVRENHGRSTFSLANGISYVFDPQDKTPDTPGNLAYTRLLPNESGYLVLRMGPKSSVPFAAGQLVDIFSAKFGDQHKPVPGAGDDNSKFLVVQPVTLTRTVEGFELAA